MKKITIITFLIIMILSLNVSADTIILKDGSAVNGKITQMNENEVIINTGKTYTYLKKEVKNIIFNKKEEKAKVDEKVVEDGPESWYMSATLGYSRIDHKKELDFYDDWDKVASGNVSFSIYGSINKKWLIGGGLHFAGSFYDKAPDGSAIEGDEHGVMAALLSFDMKYFFDRICNGFYLEGSVGFGSITIIDHWKDGEKDHIREETQTGFGLKWGIGYSIELSKYETALLIGVGGMYVYAPHKEGNDEEFESGKKWAVKAHNIYVGLLW